MPLDALIDRGALGHLAREHAAPDEPSGPHTNRGVSVADGIAPRDATFRFDYYRCSPQADLSELLIVLNYELSQALGPVRRGERPPVRHYAEGTCFLDAADTNVCSLLWGGRNCRPNLIASGSSSQVVADIVRREWRHHPSRLDSCTDVARPGLFDELRRTTEEFAKRWRIQRQTWFVDDADKGDTIYLGSRTSQFFVRIYQPGLKRAQEAGRVGADILQEERDAVRLELELKPQHPRAQQRAASVSPLECWGMSRWTTDLLKEVLAMDVEPIRVSAYRERDFDRALRFMCQQYRGYLAGLLEIHGGDLDAFALDLLTRADLAQRPGEGTTRDSGV